MNEFVHFWRIQDGHGLKGAPPDGHILRFVLQGGQQAFFDERAVLGEEFVQLGELGEFAEANGGGGANAGGRVAGQEVAEGRNDASFLVLPETLDGALSHSFFIVLEATAENGAEV